MASDVITVSCSCGQKFRASARQGGMIFACRSCGQQLRVPVQLPEEVPPSHDVDAPEVAEQIRERAVARRARRNRLLIFWASIGGVLFLIFVLGSLLQLGLLPPRLGTAVLGLIVMLAILFILALFIHALTMRDYSGWRAFGVGAFTLGLLIWASAPAVEEPLLSQGRQHTGILMGGFGALIYLLAAVAREVQQLREMQEPPPSAGKSD